ncbi:MAG: type IV toxin-antitoxin system AbiEi family antitoxin, partial [Thermodesulfobacteriota bacterium]|nr:type IV toxin-antitoxin system AbiEi family antitoxin [Thermodesulfobacteriota bacterium]
MEKMKENELLELALEALRNNLPGQTEIKTVKPLRAPGLGADYLLRIVMHGKEIRYYAEIKANLTKADKLLAMMRKGEFDHPLLLVTQYINTQLADELKQNGIEFIDTAGNAFINQTPLYIFVKGNKPNIVKAPPPKRTFKPAGLRVIYTFLCNPGLENKTYREIAAETGVALGTVDWIMKELKELGFLLDMGKRGQRLIQKENLLQRWVTAYPEQLRPKLTLGRFRGEYGWWQQKTLDPFKAQWGGEVAAAKLTQYLQP